MMPSTHPQTTAETRPNHHAEHPGFHGFGALIAAASFLVGRADDARLACELTDVGADDHLVDIGCGPGVAAREGARRGARVTGVDPAPMMLRVARATTVPGRIAWRDGAAEAVPVDDSDATVLWSIATVHHWRGLEAGLAEAHRVLTSGGRLLTIERRRRPGTTGHASHGWTDEQAAAFVALAESAGFTDMEITSHRVRRGTLLAVRGVRT